MTPATNGSILAHVDDITLVLVELTKHAIDIDDRPWLQRHIWWQLLSYQLRNAADRAARRLDQPWLPQLKYLSIHI
jgi:hypothetical protein